MLDTKKEYGVCSVTVKQVSGDLRRTQPNAEYYGINFTGFKARVGDSEGLRAQVERHADLSIVKTEQVRYRQSPRHNKGGE